MHTEYTFESFIPTDENNFAYRTAEAVANAPHLIYNPLVLFGPNGTGKTHLLHAIANRIRERNPDWKVVYSTCDDFVARVVHDLIVKDNTSYENLFLVPDILLLDDVHHIVGKEATQELLLSFFRRRIDANKLTVITSAVPPRDLLVMNMLEKEAKYPLFAYISAPQAETRLKIARAKAEALGLLITDAPLIYISNHTDNIRQIEGALKRILACRDFELFQFTTSNIMRMLSEEWLPTIQKSRD